MRKFSEVILSTLALTFVFSAFAATETKAQNIVNKILKRMELHANALTSVRSKITKSTHDSLLDDYEILKGNVNYIPGKGRNVNVRVDWTDPYRETLIVSKGTYVLHQPRLKQALRGKTADADKNDQASGSFAFMSMSKAQLKANYSIVYLGKEKLGGKQMWHLKLTPKKKADYKYSEIWVDGNGMPVQTKTVAKNGDSTTILLSGIEKNVRIKGSIFGLKLPKGTNIKDV